MEEFPEFIGAAAADAVSIARRQVGPFVDVGERKILKHQSRIWRLVHELFQFGLRFLAVGTFEIAELHDLDRSARTSLHWTLGFSGKLVAYRAERISSEWNYLSNEGVLEIAAYVKSRPLLRRFSEGDDDLCDSGHFGRTNTLDLPLDHRIVPKHVMHERIQHLQDRKSTRLNSSHMSISYAVFCLKKKKNQRKKQGTNTHHT